MEPIVPLTPAGVCFQRENFIQREFSADVFLQDLWNKVSLETLRDDLGAYLKVLRSAMIELINRDYADFVNLSGNLVGLDKAISNLQEPLIFIQSEIVMTEKVLDDAHSKLQFTLSEGQNCREKKLVLECLMKIPSSFNHLEKLLSNISNSVSITKLIEDDPTKGNVLERAANEFNQLQHLLIKCNNTLPMVSEMKERADQVHFSLMKCLESALIFGIEQHNRDVIRKSLRTFILLDERSFALNLIRIRLVHPEFENILNQTALKMDPQDLTGLLGKVKGFIRQKLKDLLEISESLESPQGLNFVVDCLWPEFYNALVTNLDCVFAQGNPDLFHKRYTCTADFIDYLESLSNSSHSLRKTHNFQLLIGRWNLPVYFQMRFQELAGSLEASLMKPFCESEEDQHRGHYKCTYTLLNLLMSCYSPEIYIAPLAHRFWKLSLQMMARYQKRFSEILTEQLKRFETAAATISLSLTQSSSSAKLTDLLDTASACTSNSLTLEQLVYLDSDVRLILKELPVVWDAAWKRLGLFAGKSHGDLQKAFQTSVKRFEDNLLPRITQAIISELGVQCATHLRNVTDIPRLYRRTNKEPPTKCFGYVSLLLTPINEFRTQNSDRAESVSVWTRGVLESLTQQYMAAVSDVLTSVQKTEESLKRLRKERIPTASAGISDDDKIRMQLVIDVDAYVEIALPILNGVKIREIQALLDVVESARVVFRRSPPT
nr:EOG090X03KZ [Ilyocryptus agilis]